MENELNVDVIQHGVSSCFKFSANCLYSIDDIVTKLLRDMFNFHWHIYKIHSYTCVYIVTYIYFHEF